MRLRKEELQIWVSACVGGTLVAYLFVQKLTLTFAFVFLLASACIGVMVHGLIWLIVRASRKDPIFIELKKYRDEINQMTPLVAKDRAENMLVDESKFICVKATGLVPEKVAPLGKYIVELFSKYESIEVVGTADVLGWGHIGMSDVKPGYVRIGRDLDDCVEFAIKPGEEYVYELTGSEETEKDFVDNRHLTIYHWILWEAK